MPTVPIQGRGGKHFRLFGPRWRPLLQRLRVATIACEQRAECTQRAWPCSSQPCLTSQRALVMGPLRDTCLSSEQGLVRPGEPAGRSVSGRWWWASVRLGARRSALWLGRLDVTGQEGQSPCCQWGEGPACIPTSTWCRSRGVELPGGCSRNQHSLPGLPGASTRSLFHGSFPGGSWIRSGAMSL